MLVICCSCRVAALVEPIERSCLGTIEEALSELSVLSSKTAALFSRESARSTALLAPALADASKTLLLLAVAGCSAALSMTADAAGIALLDLGSAEGASALVACVTNLKNQQNKTLRCHILQRGSLIAATKAGALLPYKNM